jgi:hypothetical protein
MQSLWYTEQELGDQQFPKWKGRISNQNNLSKKESIKAMSPNVQSVQF